MTTASAGEQLRQARTERGLTLKQVSQATKIQPWVLEALEADRLQQSMSPIYVKSFLSSYARHLHLNTEPLVTQFFPPANPTAEPSPTVALPIQSERSWEVPWPVIRRMGTMVAGCAGLLLLVRSHPLHWLSARGLQRQASVSVPLPQDKTAMETVLQLEPTEPLEIVLLAHQPTWISVKSDGKLITQRQLTAGSQETWTAHKRLELIIAKPSHVDVMLKGQPISPLVMAYQGRLLITHKHIKPLASSSE